MSNQNLWKKLGFILIDCEEIQTVLSVPIYEHIYTILILENVFHNKMLFSPAWNSQMNLLNLLTN